MNFSEDTVERVIKSLTGCPQPQEYHGEGTVEKHTIMVFLVAVSLARQHKLSDADRTMLLLAALCHDIGKPKTLTKDSSDSWHSPKHARIGANLLRNALWENPQYLTESALPLEHREQLIHLVLKHAWPVRFFERSNPEASVIKSSLVTSNLLLSLLAEADMVGRITNKAQQQQAIAKCRLYQTVSKELGCLTTQYKFHNHQSRIAWLHKGESAAPTIQVPESAKFTVTMLSGLPGAGKDTWLQENYDGPSISRDQVRKEISPKGAIDEGTVLQTFTQQTKQALAKKQNFALNATFLQAERRASFLNLIHAYGGRSKIIYFEQPKSVIRKRLKKRADSGGMAVPNSVVDKMACKMEPPTLLEAHEVVYIS